VGIRHLSNGIAGVSGYRTDDYLYLPVGITARTVVGSHNALSFNVEYDHLLHGWQRTHDSQLGGGDVPATSIAPAFTIEGFSDISFDQHSGWGLRAGAKYQITKHWSVEPEYIHWSVGDSPVNYETATFTVNGITARQQLGAYEPLNRTNEFTGRLGFRF
jgi:opacity protein-like surface antigen